MSKIRLRTRIRARPLIGPVAGVAGNFQRFVTARIQLFKLPKYLIYEIFPAFAPNSAGSPQQRSEITITSVNSTIPLLNSLGNLMGSKEINYIELEQYVNTVSSSPEDNLRLKSLFDHYGSDKANPNNYYLLYSHIISSLNLGSSILEIGLGTNNLKFVSNMGIYGNPGSSIKSFRDFRDDLKVFGADIDQEILFSENRITTFRVDQLDLESLAKLAKKFPFGLDMIIDDGLHSPEANLNTLISLLPILNIGGWFVTEDIARSAQAIWQIAGFLLDRDKYEVHILAGENADLLTIQRFA